MEELHGRKEDCSEHQHAAPAARLTSNTAPCTDIAVFGRVATAPLQAAGVGCWRPYSGPLDDYEETVRDLTHAVTDYWCVISRAGDVMRTNTASESGGALKAS